MKTAAANKGYHYLDDTVALVDFLVIHGAWREEWRK